MRAVDYDIKVQSFVARLAVHGEHGGMWIPRFIDCVAIIARFARFIHSLENAEVSWAGEGVAPDFETEFVVFVGGVFIWMCQGLVVGWTKDIVAFRYTRNRENLGAAAKIV